MLSRAIHMNVVP